MRATLSSPGESGELPTGQSFGALMRLNALDSVWDDFTRHCTPARMSDYLEYLERMRAITREVRQPVPMKNIGCCVDLIWGDRDRMTRSTPRAISTRACATTGSRCSPIAGITRAWSVWSRLRP